MVLNSHLFDNYLTNQARKDMCLNAKGCMINLGSNINCKESYVDMQKVVCQITFQFNTEKVVYYCNYLIYKFNVLKVTLYISYYGNSRQKYNNEIIRKQSVFLCSAVK